MLEDISQHVLDIAENSVEAGGRNVLVEINEDVVNNILSLVVQDDGRGMSPEFLKRVTDPFTTTRTTRRVGMGLPFLKQAAELCGGKFSLASTLGVGTRTEASFLYDSIDRPPLGDMPATIMTLFMGHPEIAWTYRHLYNGKPFTLTTEELVDILEDAELLRTTEVGLWIRDSVAEALEDLRT